MLFLIHLDGAECELVYRAYLDVGVLMGWANLSPGWDWIMWWKAQSLAWPDEKSLQVNDNVQTTARWPIQITKSQVASPRPIN